MLTASEARMLSGPTVKERIEELEPSIRKACERKEREIAIHDEWWVHAGYASNHEGWKEAKKILKDLGYELDFFYEERQFVNMYAIVRW